MLWKLAWQLSFLSASNLQAHESSPTVFLFTYSDDGALVLGTRAAFLEKTCLLIAIEFVMRPGEYPDRLRELALPYPLSGNCSSERRVGRIFLLPGTGVNRKITLFWKRNKEEDRSVFMPMLGTRPGQGFGEAESRLWQLNSLTLPSALFNAISLHFAHFSLMLAFDSFSSQSLLLAFSRSSPALLAFLPSC
jgi:hypothetical protein